ncbi:hypothetical protein BQ8482_140016 [Mesorhizobium delmotii]|uniref:Uncharacterized protein n=1 Tax=Mesorhizobium delmotii TaxID=1631247 RepID=A0A2P9AGX0_9HYPH|nr:hypothetical protein BQ8482_140016 [Mesorhizobium delmotii]
MLHAFDGFPAAADFALSDGLELERDRLGKWDVVHHFLLLSVFSEQVASSIKQEAARSAPMDEMVRLPARFKTSPSPALVAPDPCPCRLNGRLYVVVRRFEKPDQRRHPCRRQRAALIHQRLIGADPGKGLAQLFDRRAGRGDVGDDGVVHRAQHRNDVVACHGHDILHAACRRDPQMTVETGITSTIWQQKNLAAGQNLGLDFGLTITKSKLPVAERDRQNPGSAKLFGVPRTMLLHGGCSYENRIRLFPALSVEHRFRPYLHPAGKRASGSRNLAAL